MIRETHLQCQMTLQSRDHVTNSKLNISSSARFLTTQHDRLVTYGQKNLPMDSDDPMTKR